MEPCSTHSAMQNMIHSDCLLILAGRGPPAAVAALVARRAWRATASGLAVAGLAGTASPLAEPAAAAVAGLPAGFLAADAALVVLGAVLAIGSALVAVLDRRSAPTIAGAVALVPGGIAAGAGARRGLVAAAPSGALVALGAGGGRPRCRAVAGRPVPAVRSAGRSRPTSHPRALVRPRLLAGALAAAIGPHLGRRRRWASSSPPGRATCSSGREGGPATPARARCSRSRSCRPGGSWRRSRVR